LVDLFVNAWGDGLKWVNKSDGGPHEANFLKLDSSKIKRVFGWKPVWHIDETIDRVVEWTRVYRDGGDLPAVMDKQIKDYING
jgi:CDP-glucose 4,6-dehydratase